MTYQFDPLTILIVEDDEIDMMSVRRVLQSLKIANRKVHAKDGVEALNFLQGEQGFEKITGEIVILLDLNMPRIDGLQFLKTLENHEALDRCKIYVLTTSEADTDIVGAHQHNIEGYILKSHLKEGITEIFKQLRGQYWSTLGIRRQ